ncbi:chromate efflux transporter [Marinomonas sp. M1K-6]|uniref:Chromate efflux transporter n=1 Tax=Marinomonas profundi TaxID=2726122 RepID=A0A847R6F3_9GAMM|nr:chromate efflux transporter [Marinomonas profundi]NLQ18073.1 chromate efflux transporter [Marinomonas profundi]UDV04140.1 chromate efflux transporter [Marinomonas profundi]
MSDQQRPYFNRVFEVFIAFFLLGFTSFGGPAAHLGYFNQTFIKRKQWASDAQYAQWVALSQIVPGPGSSQVGFALGYHRAGWMGGLAAFVGFTLPSFVVMVLLVQFGHYWQGNGVFDGVVQALKLLAVVVVADACVSMWRSFCQRKTMALMALLSAAFLIVFPLAFASLVVLCIAACVGFFLSASTTSHDDPLPKVRFAGFFVLLAGALFLLSFVLDTGLSGLFAEFYQAGALVFGGGHVVLPMLSAFVSDRVSDANLLVGYAAAQAVPGPMFTMASFLGASAAPQGGNIWLWAGVATVAVFLSGLLLMLGAQNVWQRLSSNVRCRGVVGSLNAAVVGILIAALYHPIATSSLVSIGDVIFVVAGFVWLKYKRPSIFKVIGVFVFIGLVQGYW